MICVGIDSSAKTAGVAVMQDERLLYESVLNVGTTHSQTLLPMLQTALSACGLTADAVDLYAVCSGPGSFTGLRIGLALVKGLAMPRQVPCAGVSTLEALACSYIGDGVILPALDARHGEVYWAAFDMQTGERLQPDQASAVEKAVAFAENCKKPVFFVGDGGALCYNNHNSVPQAVSGPPALLCGRAAGVCLAGLRALKRGEVTSPALLLPSYHKLSQAERERTLREHENRCAP